MLGTYVFAGTVTGVVVSTNNGDNWSIINTGLENKKVQTINSIENYLFAGTEINGMFRSTNYGINWTQVNNGLSEYTTVISSSVFDNDIYIGTFCQVFIKVQTMVMIGFKLIMA